MIFVVFYYHLFTYEQTIDFIGQFCDALHPVTSRPCVPILHKGFVLVQCYAHLLLNLWVCVVSVCFFNQLKLASLFIISLLFTFLLVNCHAVVGIDLTYYSGSTFNLTKKL